MLTIGTTQPVLVTGATGYVAGWIVRGLLEAGVTVHAPVRDPESTAKVGHLQDMSRELPGTLRLFQADLLQSGSYGPAMQGCGLVFHTASPFSLRVKDPQRDLVDPALAGTRNVLETVNAMGGVRRVVLTSSVVAIYDDNVDVARAPQGRLDESVWNTGSSLDHNPYAYSKTLAERAAWEMAQAQSCWDLVVVNPSLVLGPALNPRPSSESFALIKRLTSGAMRSGAPRWPMGVVDVRDLAQAHLAAGFTPGAEGRHIISGHESDLFEMAQILRDQFGDRFALPTRVAPKWLVWLAAPFAGGGLTRQMVARNVGHPWRSDTSKAVQAWGQSYRPLDDSLTDMVTQMYGDA